MDLATYLSQENWTDAGFARVIGVSDVTVRRWRLGEARPEWKHVGKIRSATGGKVTAADFEPREPEAA